MERATVMPRRTYKTSLMLSFGARLRALRAEQGLSLTQFSERTGIAKGNLSTIECGFSAVTIETVEKLALGLELSPLLLLSFPEEDKLAAIVDLVRQVPITRRKRLRRILERWIVEGGDNS
jgi:transcriptional regulator with XRE-family HTH domain